jgi:MOSC domain-containing protein YiiM
MGASLFLSGTVYQINIKGRVHGSRGLPKAPVVSATVNKEGLEGDFNVYRHEKLDDDPDSAVLLIPLETIQQLNTEGWPIKPGDLGENITTLGIPYGNFSPEKTLSLGEVEVQISRACEPCTNLYLLPYVGKEKGPRFLKTMLHRRGWYARVIKQGTIRKGDQITFLS